MNSARIAKFVVPFVVVSAGLSTVAHAGASYISVFHSILARPDGQGEFDVAKGSNAISPFDDIATAERTWTPEPEITQRNFSSVSMHSTLDPELMAARGSLEAVIEQNGLPVGGMGDAFVNLAFQVKFTLSEAHKYALSTEYVEDSEDNDFTVRLAAEDGTKIVDRRQIDGLENLYYNGVLPAGKYTFTFFGEADSTIRSTIDYDAKLALTPITSAVPLPPALASGLFTIAGLLVGARVRKQVASR